MTLGEWAGQAYVAAHLSPCFEPETDDDAGWEAVAKKETEWSVSAIAEIIRAAIAEEREGIAAFLESIKEHREGDTMLRGVDERDGPNGWRPLTLTEAKLLRAAAAALRARGGS